MAIGINIFLVADWEETVFRSDFVPPLDRRNDFLSQRHLRYLGCIGQLPPTPEDQCQAYESENIYLSSHRVGEELIDLL